MASINLTSRLSVATQEGRRARKLVSRSDHAELVLPPNRNVLEQVHARNVGRIPELIPVRTQRMAESAFAFFRGSADLMAADLAASPHIGVNMVICGDAHLANFGLFASPERRMLFDLNDFDESGIGPWEWDIKRLAASTVLAAREGDVHASDDEARELVKTMVTVYKTGMHQLAESGILERYYADVDAEWLSRNASDRDSAYLDKVIGKARNRTSLQAVRKIATFTDQRGVHFQSDPPILVPVRDEAEVEAMVNTYSAYLSSLPPAPNLLLKQFRLVDVARRVVGVGSVGTRALIVLLMGPDGEPLVLQVKEALPTVLTTHGGLLDGFASTSSSGAGSAKDTRAGGDGTGDEPISPLHYDRSGDGYRVVASQQILQAHSDPLLGWATGADGHSYYWRQFRDMKGSIELEHLTTKGLSHYCELCARLLARAHSQSPNNAQVAGYIGNNDEFAEAIAEWAIAYANQTVEDYEEFRQAIADGEFELPEEEPLALASDLAEQHPNESELKSPFDRALGL